MLREILFTKKGAPADELFTRLFLRAPVMERELTGALPLSFNSDGTPLLDWRINGSAGGLGTTGKNYLKQTEKVNIDNGAIGIRIGEQSNWLNANEGITVNSGEATRLFVTFQRGEEAAISPEDVGQFVLTEASENENLYKGVLRNGGAKAYKVGNSRDTAPYILLPVGDNGDGRILYYGDTDNTIFTRVRTESIKVKPNTDYRIFTVGAAADVLLSYEFLGEPGYIWNQYANPSYVKSIPGDETMVTNVEQWCRLQYTHYYRPTDAVGKPYDCRPMLYDYCESFADLKAGTYKLIVEICGNYFMSGISFVGMGSPTVYIETNWDSDETIDREWFALLAEDNSPIIPRMRLYPSDDKRYISKKDGPPYPTYFHYEYEFTVDKDTKVGLIHKAYYESISDSKSPFYRFMIVDPDVEAEPFETTNVTSNLVQSGVTSWEPYHCVLPITVSCGEQSQVITIDMGDSLLGEGESISLADTSINIPTYIGRNTISIETNNDAPAEMYIRYMG